MQYRSRARAARRFSVLPIAFGMALLAAVGGALFVGVKMLMAPRPQIALGAPFEVVGGNAALVVDVKDEHGLRSLRVAIVQEGEERVIAEESYDEPRSNAQVRWAPLKETRFRLREGPGKLRVEARNASWGNFFRGKASTFEREFTARLTPPRVEVLTTQHYVNQGGCDVVVYRVTPPTAESGVVVGERFFKGFELPGAADAGVRFALFAYPYDAPAGTLPRLKAKDEASNEVLANFAVKVFPKTFRERTLELDDAFLGKVVPEIMSQTPSLPDQTDLLKNYLQINRDLRRANNEALGGLAARSQARRLWTEPFQQLGSSQVEASFADHRRYVYKGQEVDRQDHLGYDLATTANSPVSASNDGLVLLAEYFGIYGNTVVLDHGYGLLSVYGHLASFAVKSGDAVKRGRVLGQSGATGLAGGDHLHFSVVLQGEQVDAREWWDPHWLEDRVFVKLRQFGAAGASPVPTAGASPPSPEASPSR